MLALIVALTLGGLASACETATSQLPSTSPSPPAPPSRHSPASRSQPPLPLPIPFPDSVAFERAVAGAGAVPRIPIAGARLVVIPHHWPAGHLALAALRDAVPPPDAESIAALAALDGARLLSWSDEHMDARGAARTAMALARRLGATRWVLRERTDGSRLPGYEGGPVTSYVVGYYAGP